MKMTKDEAHAVLARRNLHTYAHALDARVALDVARWGESERHASRRMHEGRSHAILVNSIAVFDVSAVDSELQLAAKALMTPGDVAELRKGG